MAIKLISDSKQWDDFIDRSICGLIYHKWDFLKIVERYTNFDLLSYGVFKGATLICIFPLFYKKINGLKCLFSPPPSVRNTLPGICYTSKLRRPKTR